MAGKNSTYQSNPPLSNEKELNQVSQYLSTTKYIFGKIGTGTLKPKDYSVLLRTVSDDMTSSLNHLKTLASDYKLQEMGVKEDNIEEVRKFLDDAASISARIPKAVTIFEKNPKLDKDAERLCLSLVEELSKLQGNLRQFISSFNVLPDQEKEANDDK
jgi:hypothetical protein